jgi:hypothetical protein
MGAHTHTPLVISSFRKTHVFPKGHRFDSPTLLKNITKMNSHTHAQVSSRSLMVDQMLGRATQVDAVEDPVSQQPPLESEMEEEVRPTGQTIRNVVAFPTITRRRECPSEKMEAMVCVYVCTCVLRF